MALLKPGRGSFGAWQLTIGVGFPGSSHHCAGVAFFPSITGLWLSQKVRRCWPLIGQWESPLSFCLLAHNSLGSLVGSPRHYTVPDCSSVEGSLPAKV